MKILNSKNCLTIFFLNLKIVTIFKMGTKKEEEQLWFLKPIAKPEPTKWELPNTRINTK
jgi:hypothetical protein